MIKKIFGYLLFLLAILLGLALLLQIGAIMHSVSTIFLSIFSAERDDYRFGEAIGSVIAYLFFIGVIIGLFFLGNRLIKKKEQK